MKAQLLIGRKTIKATAKQIEAKNKALDPSKQIILYGGAIRGGKSYWLILMFHSLAIEYPKSKWLLLRESLPTLRRTLIPTFKKLYDEGLAPYIKSVNQQTNVVAYHNGSELIFMAENYAQDKDLDRFKGLEINGAGIDEVNEIQEKTFYKIIERAGSHITENKPPIKILATCNPSNNWVKSLFYDRHVNNLLPDSWEYITAKITDNPHVPDSYLQSLSENLPESLYRKFVDGDWDAIENDSPFIDQFRVDVHICPVVFNPNYDIHLSFDFNITNTCLVIQNVGDEIRVIKEYHVKGWDLERLCAEIYTEYKGLYIINGDASGNSRSGLTSGNASAYELIKSFLKLSWEQFYVPPANPSHINSRLLCNMIFKKEKISIDPSCTGLKKDIELVKVLPGGNIDKSDDNLTHHLDPLRYHFNAHHYHVLSKYGLDSFAR